MNVMATARRTLRLAGCALMVATVASAQVGQATGGWRIGASTGGYVPHSALIRAADSNDTRLGSGPAISFDLQYLASSLISVYAGGVVGFGTITLGSSIRPTVVGPSNHVMVSAGTVGLLLAPTGWLGSHIQPTFRLGGGFKWYAFDLAETRNQVRPTIDIGLGLRGVGTGPIEVTAEVRYLMQLVRSGQTAHPRHRPAEPAPERPGLCGRVRDPTLARIPSARRARQILHGTGEQSHLGPIASTAQVAIQLGRQSIQRVPPPGTGCRLGAGQRLPHGGDSPVRQPLRPLQLIDVRPRQREARRPDELRLTLRVQVVVVHRLRRVDLVLRDELARRQLEDVETRARSRSSP